MSQILWSDDPRSVNEAVAKLRLQLSEIPLRELDRQDVVDWDVDANVVREGSQFDDRWSIFDNRTRSGR